MADTSVSTAPEPNLVTVTHVVYGLHALSLLIGVTTAATIVGAFVFGVPSIIAVVINYLKRREARGTFLESHCRWQIRTFWFALLWCMVGGVLFLNLRGYPACGRCFLRDRRVGYLSDRSRVAGAARSKADVYKQLIPDAVLNSLTVH
jgi:uncharacterized membrane protein